MSGPGECKQKWEVQGTEECGPLRAAVVRGERRRQREGQAVEIS